jgi:hypothetical protein
MEADRFDDIVRTLSATPSRRAIARAMSGFALAGGMGTLLGLADAESRKRKRKHKKKKRCTPRCTGRVCGKDGCGGTCGVACTNGRVCQNGTCRCPTECCVDPDCAAGQLCAQGQCVTGQGACALGTDACLTPLPTCGAPSCYCSTRNGTTRCGNHVPISACDSCTSDADCAALRPDVPGAFCTTGSAGRCACQNFCRAPCPS